ncbi:MAG: GNAT family N-acetyltransferase [Myxococcales bacterium]|nr:GNAT family N-acetyltransferase [Myxococcales bacterium]
MTDWGTARPQPGDHKPEVRLFTAQDAESTETLWSAVFHRTRSKNLWRWLYDENPAGAALRAVAVVDGQVVAHAALVPRRFVFAETLLNGGLSIDAMTAVSWRRQGLNRRLWAVLESEIVRHNLAFIFGFSNENSTAGAQTYQGRQPIHPFPLLVRPIVGVRSTLAMCRPTSWNDPASSERIPDDFFHVGSDWRGASGLRPVVDKTYALWRYGRPDGLYRWASVVHSGRTVACGAVAFRRQWGLRAAFLMHTKAETALAYQALVGKLIRRSTDAGAVVMVALAHFGTAEHRALQKVGFISVPDRLKMEQISLSFRLLAPANQAGVTLDPKLLQIGWAEHDLL